ncbi:hypothetical protein BGW80DRAFT_1281492 [Lactifluus volemus]|nr:hypothetical protein BGW80DRAFT_1281492 [Lactifluus volemus]
MAGRCPFVLIWAQSFHQPGTRPHHQPDPFTHRRSFVPSERTKSTPLPSCHRPSPPLHVLHQTSNLCSMLP